MINYKTNLNCNLNEFHNWNNTGLLAVNAPHSGDWLLALSLSNCGLLLDDSAVHMAIGLRLGANNCEKHQGPSGALVDARGLHGLLCKGAPADLHDITD